MKEKVNLKSSLIFVGLSSAIALAAVVSSNTHFGTDKISNVVTLESTATSSESKLEPLEVINTVSIEPGVVSGSSLIKSSEASKDALQGLNLKQIVDTLDIAELTSSLGLSRLPDEDSVPLMNNEILVQGDETEVLRKLIEKIGGLVTHELPIVGGVGVRVTDFQLEILERLPVFVKSTLNQPIFISSALDHCLVYGSHVADLTANKIRWNLYNARDMKANIKQMTFAWPEDLGNVNLVKFNGKTVFLSLLSQQNGELTLDADTLLSSANLIAYEDATLELTFSRFGTENYEQRDFSMDVQFEEGCDRSLVKGYDTQAKFDDSNSYYVNNIGADKLHDKGITGKNVTVAVIDSGLWGAHSALNSNTKNQLRIKE